MDVLRGVLRHRIHRDNTAKTKAAIVSLHVFSLKLAVVGPGNYSSETKD